MMHVPRVASCLRKVSFAKNDIIPLRTALLTIDGFTGNQRQSFLNEKRTEFIEQCFPVTYSSEVE